MTANFKKTLIGVIYRPPKYSNLGVFNEYIQTILHKLSNTKNRSFIMSDFNIDMLNITDTTTTFLNTMSTFYFKPNIINPIKENNEGKFTSLIDNIFSNTTNDSFSGTMLHLRSHTYILFSLYKKTDYGPRHAKYTRNFTNSSVNDFIRKISQENWITVYQKIIILKMHIKTSQKSSTPITIPDSQS